MPLAKLKIPKLLRPVRLVVLTKMVAKYPDQPVEVWAEELLLGLMDPVLVLLSVMVLLVLYR